MCHIPTQYGICGYVSGPKVREIRKYWQKSTSSAVFCSEYVGKNIEFRGNGLTLNIDDSTQAKSVD
jgi:hypothetical protein